MPQPPKEVGSLSISCLQGEGEQVVSDGVAVDVEDGCAAQAKAGALRRPRTGAQRAYVACRLLRVSRLPPRGAVPWAARGCLRGTSSCRCVPRRRERPARDTSRGLPCAQGRLRGPAPSASGGLPLASPHCRLLETSIP